jgi:multidrug efflux pump subunit AcrA (membrane-fusion protein)
MRRVTFLRNRNLTIVVVTTMAIVAAGAFVLWPAYVNPESRLYTTALGYLKVQRLLGIKLHAVAEHPVLHDFETPLLGEGTMQCNFYNVPVVPLARVAALHVEEGDKVEAGQLLAELDDTVAVLGLESAQLAVATAMAQQQRVEAGSVNGLQAERPEKDRISVEGLAETVKSAQKKVEMYRQLQERGGASRLELVNAEIELDTAETAYNQARFDSVMSSEGLPQSRVIAQNAVVDAKNLLQQRQEALKYYRITAPAGGTIDKVLIRDGEYNQGAGNPGFIIASGLWFEANLDQKALAEVHEGMEAIVSLEAYTGRPLRATVERIIPIVTFNAGGPETTTPVRPLGTGSPEWPATFKVRLHVEADGVKLTPGMTGFVRVICHRQKGLAVPREAVTTLSAGKGIVRTVDSSGHHTGILVSLGHVDERFVEITEGLDASEWVLTRNPPFLRDDDELDITRLAVTGP